MKDTKTEFGEVKIHQKVIASIACEATKQIPGVVKIGGNLIAYLFELLGQKETSTVKIEFDKNNDAIITIPVVVKFGYNIPEIASKVQENVKLAIESATNIIVKNIDVNIQGVEK